MEVGWKTVLWFGYLEKHGMTSAVQTFAMVSVISMQGLRPK